MPNDSRCYLEVIPSMIHQNGLKVHQFIGNTKLMSVLKGDAYGLGIQRCALALKDVTDWFAVATAEEALAIREVAVEKPILVLGYVPSSQIQEMVRHQITLTVISVKDVERIQSALEKDERVQVHIAVDTGLTRIGLFSQTMTASELVEQARIILKMDGIDVTGIFTHFAVAGSSDVKDQNFTTSQYALFREVVSLLEQEGYLLGIKHCCNSNAILENPDMYEDMVRCGKFLFGFGQSHDLDLLGCELAFNLQARVVRVAMSTANTNIGYGRVYKTQRPSKIATISFGFGDGYRREMGENTPVLVNGNRAKIVGRVAMDYMMIDATEIPDISAGDYVTLMGHNDSKVIMPNEVSHLVNASTNEIIGNLNKRVLRTYLDENGKEI
ncbi:alanine racemase [Lacticaseibacillus paracasei]|uniref:Alanine racemase C-terminal domain-containing protein n=1 Tax=Lacticaseibacillus paracasei NRIC 0644 TaxID=1435038 RepID=A0A0C9Q772_LACPA|nr:alanine racemase [Lacticaseibacillus paracasei]MXI84816.1 alanine racemase [Lacticaseibacillus paracasei]GAN35667.1 hypothetical protein LC0644_0256 [Lacticaseibacillus paracasei NRIC 0644]GAN38188.1 hypothetical protein LC1917_0065 [Lacticaseibacillus paracasei NRIC 1917]